MAIRNTQPDDETVTDNIDDRTRRALETPMSVTSPDGTTVDRGETMVLVTSGSSGSGYMVDVTGGRCECKDHRNRRVECKHIRRARIEMGVTPVSTATLAAVDPDSKLGVNTPGPRIDTSEGELMADGGRLFTESTERYEAVECRHGDGEHLVFVDEPDELGRRCIGWTHTDGPAHANKTVIRNELRRRGLPHGIADHGERFEPEVLRL